MCLKTRMEIVEVDAWNHSDGERVNSYVIIGHWCVKIFTNHVLTLWCVINIEKSK